MEEAPPEEVTEPPAPPAEAPVPSAAQDPTQLIWFKVLSWLDVQELSTCKRVCSQWKTDYVEQVAKKECEYNGWPRFEMCSFLWTLQSK